MADPAIFHAHLDVCRQCREHPFGLCPVGHIALVTAVEAVHPSLQPPPPPRKRRVEPEPCSRCHMTPEPEDSEQDPFDGDPCDCIPPWRLAEGADDLPASRVLRECRRLLRELGRLA